MDLKIYREVPVDIHPSFKGLFFLGLGLATACRGTNNGASLKDDPGAPSAPSAAAAAAGNGTGPVSGVLEHHNHQSRDGLYADPALTRAAAAGLHLDPTFKVSFDGAVYAQPLYLDNGPSGKSVIIVATENNDVMAFDAASGAKVWGQNLGPAVPRAALPCGNIDPLGVTGTPVVDAQSRTLVVDAMVGANNAPHHKIYALSIDDGTIKQGWPVDVDSQIQGFESLVQNQRGALTIVNGTAYVPYGGHWGDCPDAQNNYYHGVVVGVPLANPGGATAWTTPAAGGGVWAPGGVASDGTSVYVATGNTFDAGNWSAGEAVIRLAAGPSFSTQAPDYFSPGNWSTLDDNDLDIGGAAPVLLHVDGATPPELIASFGKDGNAFLIARDNMGGIGNPLFTLKVNSQQIITAPAAVTTGSGTIVVAHNYTGSVVGCPAGQGGTMFGMKVNPSPVSGSLVWCVTASGRGAPAISTTDGQSESVAWVVGSETDNKLRGYNAETGQLLVTTSAMGKVRRFETPIVAHGRIFVAGDGRVYAFTP